MSSSLIPSPLPSSSFVNVIIVAGVAALAAWTFLGAAAPGWWPRSLAGSAPGAAAPHPRFPDFKEYDRWAAEDLARARDMLLRFSKAYQRTFSSCSRALMTDMHETRKRALTSLYAARLRLPNDAVAEAAMTAQIEGVDRTTLSHTEDFARRCQLGLVHPGPVHDHHYSRWYRAFND